LRLATYVDDIIVRGRKKHIREFFKKLADKFEVKPPTYLCEEDEIYFLGMRLTQTYRDGVKWYHADQQRDMEAFLEDMGCVAARPVAAPMPSRSLIDSDPTPLSKAEQTKFRSAIGSLQYFVSCTQWHLAHCVSRLAQFNCAATKGVQKQLQQTLAWIRHNTHRSLSGPVLKDTTWSVYSDSDHAGDRSLGTRSHTGVALMCNGAMVHWRSNKQPVTAVSSAAAEIYAMAEAARDTRLHVWKAEELGLTPPKPMEIKVDNTSGIVFQTKMNPQSRLKGMIDLRWNWVKELQDAGQIRAVKVDTLLNVADLLTKCQPRVAYERLVSVVEESALQLAEGRALQLRNAKYNMK
jgi:hypothetical protein